MTPDVEMSILTILVGLIAALLIDMILPHGASLMSSTATIRDLLAAVKCSGPCKRRLKYGTTVLIEGEMIRCLDCASKAARLEEAALQQEAAAPQEATSHGD